MIDFLCDQIKQYSGLKIDTRRLLSTKEIHSLIDRDYSHIDPYNIIIDERYVLLSDGGSSHSDLSRAKKLCVLCTYDIKEKKFEVVEVTKKLVFENHLVFTVDPLIQHIKFENEVSGASSFIFFSNLESISVRVRYKTYRNFPRHLRHDINCKRVWIREFV